MMWFDKNHHQTVYGDKRIAHDVRRREGKNLSVVPDVQLCFTALPFADETFQLVAFDPPHDNHTPDYSITARIYGKLFHDWETMLTAGFAECFRVLQPGGILIFKWSEVRIPVSRVLALTPHAPLFGHRTGRQGRTHWLTFMKGAAYAISRETSRGRQRAHGLTFPASLAR